MPATRRRSYQQVPHLPTLDAFADPLEQPAYRPEEHEPMHPEDLHAISKRPQCFALFVRPVDVAAIRIPEDRLADLLDPAVVDREQHDREHEANRNPGQQAPGHDGHEDREYDHVFAPGEPPALVP